MGGKNCLGIRNLRGTKRTVCIFGLLSTAVLILYPTNVLPSSGIQDRAPESTTVYSGQDATFMCTADKALDVKMKFDPPISPSRITHNQSTPQASTGLLTTTAVIKNVMLDDDGTTVECCILRIDTLSEVCLAQVAKLWVIAEVTVKTGNPSQKKSSSQAIGTGVQVILVTCGAVAAGGIVIGIGIVTLAICMYSRQRKRKASPDDV